MTNHHAAFFVDAAKKLYDGAQEQVAAHGMAAVPWEHADRADVTAAIECAIAAHALHDTALDTAKAKAGLRRRNAFAASRKEQS